MSRRWRHPALPVPGMAPALALCLATASIAPWKRSRHDPHQYRPLASTLARAGCAVWAPEYRRVGEDGGGWPGTFDDARAALAAVPRLLGGAAQTVTERYREASPSRPDGPAVATRLLHGSDDGVVPLAQSRALPGAELEILDGAGHYDLIHPGTPALPALLSAIEDLLSP